MKLYKKIVNDIYQKGYTNTLITYKQFLELYNPYKNELSEKDFANAIGMCIQSYYKIKRDSKARAYILREKGITSKRRNEIVNNLIQQGWGNKDISLSDFVEIYELYKNEMNRSKFANILGISKSTFRALKSGDIKTVKVLRMEKPRAKERAQIINTLKNQGYVNRNINYEKFLKLYEPYKFLYSEDDFAEVIGITSARLSKIKKDPTNKSIILETDRPSIELIRKIREELIFKGYANKTITYEEFLKLFEDYRNEVKQTDFAGILGIKVNTYYKFKLGKSKAIILKDINQDYEKSSNIRMDLKSKGYSETLIDYKKFLELYQLYEGFTETEFAEILGISFTGLSNLKKDPCRRILILKHEKISIEQEEKIREELISRGYSNKWIDYNEFLELYRPYSLIMTEIQFLKIVQLSYYAYVDIKYNKQKTRIFRTKSYLNKKANEICVKLKEMGYTNRYISYMEFKELYKIVSNEMDEHQFADMLEITSGCYNAMKYTNSTTRILKTDNLPEIEKDKITKHIIEELQDINYKNINLDGFMEFYKKYEFFITKERFSEILGVSISELKKNNQTVILNKRAFELTKYQLYANPRKYTKAEIEQKCQENGITRYDFFVIWKKVYITKRWDSVEKLMNLNEVFLGVIPISEDFQNKYANRILDFAMKKSKALGYRFKTEAEYEDIAIDTIMYVFKMKGNLVENAANELEALEKIYSYIYIYMKYLHMSFLTKIKFISLDEKISDDPKSGDLYNFVTNSNNTPEQIVLSNNNDREENSFLDEAKKMIEYGVSVQRVIEELGYKYNISSEELLNIICEELNKRKKISVTKNGEVYLDEVE